MQRCEGSPFPEISGYKHSQPDRCPLQRFVDGGEVGQWTWSPAEKPKCRFISLKPIGIATFHALKFEIVRHTRLLKRKFSHSRNFTLRVPLRYRWVFLEFPVFTLPTVWLVSSFFRNPFPRDLESCAEESKRRRCYVAKLQSCSPERLRKKKRRKGGQLNGDWLLTWSHLK